MTEQAALIKQYVINNPSTGFIGWLDTRYMTEEQVNQKNKELEGTGYKWIPWNSGKES
jgi:hypothetical protein